MFNPGAYENSRPDGISVLEIVNGAEPGDNPPRRFVPLRRTELRGEIAGPLASLRLTQVYRFSREQCPEVVEAVYRFPLPGDAAVTAVRVRFGAVEIRAGLKERHKAEKEYEEAKQKGKQAALLTRESPDVFTLHVAGLEPDQDVTVETSYVQLARGEGPGWTLRIPLTTAPRYVRGDEQTSRQAQGQPLFLLRDPGHRFALDLTLAAEATVTSPTHELEVTPHSGGGLRLRLKEEEVIPDRDCVLCWRPTQEPERPALHVLLHDDPAAEQVYFLAQLAPPARPAGPGVPREVILLVDHSGSMQGPKWAAADWAVKQFLAGLSERDAFALGVFHDKTIWLGKAPRPADTRAVQKAVQFLEKHTDSGGTELGVALEQALDRQRGSGEAARHVLLITDAEVSDAGRILRLADQEAREKQRRRIDVLCIDAAPNSFLALELAQRGGGVAKFLTSAPEEEDITTALDEVLADWSQPVASGLRLEVQPGPVEAAGHALLEGKKMAGAIDLGDLPAGRTLWVVGRVPRARAADPGRLAFRVLTSADREVAGCQVDLAREAGDRPALKALFGARRVLGLEYVVTSGYSGTDLTDQLARLGYDPKEALADRPKKKAKVYAENIREDASELLRQLLVREALHYGLACSETAFVAVRSEAGKPVKGTVLVANALPTGWSESFLAGGRGGLAGGSMFLACLKAPPMAPFADPAGGGMVDACMADVDSSTLSEAYDDLHSAALEPDFEEEDAGPGSPLLFAGVPTFQGGQALLFDSARAEDAEKLPDSVTFVRLQVDFPDGRPEADALDPGLSLLLFVEDLAAPRARVRLADLVRQGGTRPLHVLRKSGQPVRIVLADPAGVWAKAAPALQVSLHGA
jgi:Ca-activated chloride channel family protein